MSDFQKDLDAAARLGRQEGAQGRPPAHATEPDVNEIAFATSTHSKYQQQREAIITQLRDVDKRIQGVDQALVQLQASAENVPPTSGIKKATDSALSEGRAVFVRDIKRDKYARSALLRFKADRGIDRDALYDTTTWGVLQWMVIIFAAELLLNAYFYSFGVGLAGGAIVAAIFSAVTAAAGFSTGLLFRLSRERALARSVTGWIILLLGALCIIYLASLTATYRSIALVVHDQQIHAANFDYTPAYVIFGQAFTKAPAIFLFPFTLRMPFEDIQSLLLFLVSLFAFSVGFWKGDTSSDRIWGFKQVDKAHRDAESAVHEDERRLLETARSVANTHISERNAILQGFTSTSHQIAQNKAEVERLSTLLKDTSSHLADNYKLLIRTYRDNVARVYPSREPPSYFRVPPQIELDIPAQPFQEALDRGAGQKKVLDDLSGATADRLRAEITEATEQARIANESVSAFKSDCELEAERQIRDENPPAGDYENPKAS